MPAREARAIARASLIPPISGGIVLNCVVLLGLVAVIVVIGLMKRLAF